MTSPTPRQLAEELLAILERASIACILKLEIDGAPPIYLVTQPAPTLLSELPESARPEVILRSDAYSLNAVLTCRMSWADAIVARRLSANGVASKLGAIRRAIESRSPA
jgi:hypothetical protein